MTLDADAFRDAMSRFPTGVTVVTTRSPDGTPWGFTASAFCSVSLDPPLVLVCLSSSADCAQAFERTDRFAVSMLRPEHEEVALRFATKGEDKFAGLSFHDSPTMLPILEGALAAVDCGVDGRHPSGDHTILVGRVDDAWSHEGEPLVYFDRNFRRLDGAGN